MRRISPPARPSSCRRAPHAAGMHHAARAGALRRVAAAPAPIGRPLAAENPLQRGRPRRGRPARPDGSAPAHLHCVVAQAWTPTDENKLFSEIWKLHAVGDLPCAPLTAFRESSAAASLPLRANSLPARCWEAQVRGTRRQRGCGATGGRRAAMRLRRADAAAARRLRTGRRRCSASARMTRAPRRWPTTSQARLPSSLFALRPSGFLITRRCVDMG